MCSRYSMSSKHFISDATGLVHAALDSLTVLNPSLMVDIENKIIHRPFKHAEPIVSIVSGGGSGHEPSFGGFVGEGFLSAAVAGTIFASPNSQQIVRCLTSRVDKRRGVLVVVMNYTGDVLNFGMAIEKAKASGIEVEMVVVGDDVGVGREQSGKVGRRGIAGTVLVHKIAGALAATGATLQEVHEIARLISENIVSIGASLSHVHVPGREVTDPGEDDLKASEVEIGMGIHNEPGSERRTEDLPGLMRLMLARMLDENDEDRNFLRILPSDNVVLLVNNLGGVSVLEMGGVTNEAVRQLQLDYKIKPVRVLSGTFMTSLNSLGFSLTLLRLQKSAYNDRMSMLQLLDAPCEVSGWLAPISAAKWSSPPDSTPMSVEKAEEVVLKSNMMLNRNLANRALRSGLSMLIEAEPDVTHYDTIVGDGDCGIGLKRGAESVLKTLEAMDNTTDAVVFLGDITRAVESSMDGTSGAIYAIFLNALLHGLRMQDKSSANYLTLSKWIKALEYSKNALLMYTPARPGDRTLIDALHPFIDTLTETQDIKSAAVAAMEGAKRTKGMKASLGRTVYIGGEGWQGVPDPGAYGLSKFLSGMSDAF